MSFLTDAVSKPSRDKERGESMSVPAEEHLTDFIRQLQSCRPDIYNTVKLKQTRNIGGKEQNHDTTMITEHSSWH